ncbi:septation protein SpoVG family protein [Planctomicrobium sp. SH661]|uniref:septation protein SpoVG family protein n=1 Tax=Planctomicrobium sp. SH661 TaxID=3448124 RepID=UPI003F5C9A08
MEITEVRIKLMDGVQDRLLGFCSITFDRAFVVRDLKIIKGSRGAFVAMPSRKLTDRCRGCGNKNPLRSAFCSQCGIRLSENRSAKSVEGKAKLYADIAHPINSECRDQIQQRVLSAYDEELVLSQQPGYVSRYDDFGEFDLEGVDADRWDEEFARKEQALTPENWDAAIAEDPQPSTDSGDSPTQPARMEGFGEGVL